MSGQAKFLTFLLLVAVACAVYFGNQARQYQKENTLLKGQTSNPAGQARQEEDAIIAKVKKLVELPNERPQVATVTDKSKLASEPFFAKVQNGDRLLLFIKARKALIYRESTNKIINFGVLNVASQAEPTTTTTPGVSRTPTAAPSKAPSPTTAAKQ